MKQFLGISVIFVMFIIAASCNRKETFVAPQKFTSFLNLISYTTDTNGFYRVQVNGKYLNKLEVGKDNKLASILNYEFPTPGDGLVKIKISWKGYQTILVDTTLPVKAINKFYLVQLDKKAPPKFYFSFGEPNAQAPLDSTLLKVRFFYTKNPEDPTPLPDTIKVQFFRLIGSLSVNTQVQDTSVLLWDNALSPFIELPDSKYQFDGKDVFLGYQIINPKTGAILQPFCSNKGYGIVDFRSTNAPVTGKFQTATFSYIDQVTGCSGPAELYQLGALFGGN